MQTKTNIFDEFTGKYQLSKTLRFELKPVGKTEDLLKTHHILEKDYTIEDSYQQAKYYFDEVHREFLDYALVPNKAKQFSFGKLRDAYSAYLKLDAEQRRKDRNFRKAKQTFREGIKKHLDTQANEWAKQFRQHEDSNDDAEEDAGELDGKKKGTKLLCSAAVLPILKSKFPEEDDEKLKGQKQPSLFVIDRETGEKRYIFAIFDRFTTYLGKFQKTRENLYLTGGEATAVPTRIVSNFLLLLNNEKKFDENIRRRAGKSPIPNADLSLLESKNAFSAILQDGIQKYNATVGAINKQVKEWRDQAKKEEKSQYPLLERLKKQILAEVGKRIELIESDSDVIPRFREFVEETETRISEAWDLLSHLFEGDFADERQNIFINHRAANTLAYQFFIEPVAFLAELPQATKIVNKENPKVAPFISIADMVEAMKKIGEKEGEKTQIFKSRFYLEEDKKEDKQRGIISKQSDYQKQLFSVWKNEIRELYEGAEYNGGGEKIFGFNEALKQAKSLIKNMSDFGDKNRKREDDVAVIKQFADATLAIHQRLAHFALEARKEDDKPTEYSAAFYRDTEIADESVARGLSSLFRWGQKEIAIIREGRTSREIVSDERGKPLLVRYYDALRNYLTKKPDSEEKIKINFDNGSLLGGFDKNKEQEKCGIILRNENKFYLGVLRKNDISDSKKANLAMFDESKHPEAYAVSGEQYEKMEYKLFPDPKRMIPKIAFAKKNLKNFNWTQEIQAIKDEYAAFQEKKKSDRDLWGNSFDRKKLHKLIAYYQQCLEIGGYKKTFGFSWKDPATYSGMGEFNDETAKQNYKISFVPVDKKYVGERVEKEELYLFEIHNKDWNLKREGTQYVAKTGSKNLHTCYFEALLDEKNITVLKLDGAAELFYRPEAKDFKVKKDASGNVVKPWRYTKPKWQLHLKMRLNRCGVDAKRKGYTKNFNDELNTLLSKKGEGTNIIGIDRGEKHLAYFMVVDQKGNVLDGGSLNKIGEGGKEVDYYKLLHERMKEREKNRRSWEPVQQIKDLKRGYVGAAVRKICDLAIQHNAVIVFEDLSFRFKQVRGGIEKSTYQQVEKALIDKLGYLTFKDYGDNAPGGILRGYQLAAPFESFERMGKQTGIVFYTNAAYTSAIDPLTGFRKTVYIGSSTAQKKIKDTFSKFEEIFWDGKDKSYCFTYNTKDFRLESKGKKKGSVVPEQKWSVYGKAPRLARERRESGHWKAILVYPDQLLEDLFKKYEFDLRGDIKAQIEKADAKKLASKQEFNGKQRNFWERLTYIFNLICQVRNSTSREYRMSKEGKLEEIGNDVDFIASPVPPFFATGAKWDGNEIKSNLERFKGRFVTDNANKLLLEDDGNMIFNGDANGAYNIARKGIIQLKKPETPVSNDDFDKLVQNQWNPTSKSQK